MTGSQRPSISDVVLLSRERHRDERGWFEELSSSRSLAAAGINTQFVQENLSWSLPGVLRGLHFQVGQEQGKLVTCLSGSILDVAVDIRRGSATFGQHVTATLSGESGSSLWIPRGFAHGFAVVGPEPALVHYGVDQSRFPDGERGILWSDPDVGIDWPVREPILSARDAGLPLLRDYVATHPR